jgi:iron(III) transport system substrate-binding protein
VVLLLISLLIILPACSDATPPPRTVVVFTALDRVYSEPILKRFEQESGIKVLVKYDAEAAKTTGLINQIIARRDHPEADVLWNNEILQTEHLGRLGLLQPYVSPQASRFDASFRHPQGLWTAFAGRIRVCIYNTDLVAASDVPTSLGEMNDAKWRGQVAIGMPFFGTTFTHMCVLSDVWGEGALAQWAEAMKSNEAAIAAGNGPVRDMVAAGERALGLTDSDDANGAILDGRPVAITVFSAAGECPMIPNTVAMIADCRHLEEAKALIDFLLSAEVERELAAARSAQIPLASDLADVTTPWDGLIDRRQLHYDVQRAAGHRDKVAALLKQVGFDR